MRVRLSEEQKIKLQNSDDVYSIMQQVLMRENKARRNKEHFWIICLANNNRIKMVELISLGTVNCTLVDPMEVFSFALQNRAVKIILSHNHPSGELIPSAADKDLTEKMLAIGKFINVPVIDHLIITETSFYSFADEGLIDSITKSSPYDLTFANIVQLKEEIKRSKLEAKQEMALLLLDKGINISIVESVSGLTKKQINQVREANLTNTINNA
jgi:DNA repair protein RadC